MSNSVVQTSCQSIDHLPDDVLQHLLSFLPTKEAVATSILSKRWSYLWQWVPVLDLQDSPSCKSDEKQRKAFRQLVYKALIHSNVDSLYKFRLNCDIIHGPSSLNTWINAAVHRFIFQGEVDISISATGKSPFLKLPNNFFTSKSLKVVKLSNQILIDVPNSMSVCFPSLKVLHLQLVEFANGESFSRLLQGCTVLDDLFVSRFFNDNVKNLIIYVPTLKMLNIIQQLGEANWLELASQGYELKINAPNLEYLNILDLGSLVHFESIFISLIEANISFNGIGLIRLSEALCNAKFLYLQWIHSPDYIEFLNHAALPFFPNLILLQLGIGFDDWKIISHFLVRSTHQLEVLTINKIRVIGSEEPWWVSKGLSPYVTNVYGGGSPGDELGMEVVEYTLEGHSVWRLLRKFLKHRKKHSPKLIQPEI